MLKYYRRIFDANRHHLVWLENFPAERMTLECLQVIAKLKLLNHDECRKRLIVMPIDLGLPHAGLEALKSNFWELLPRLATDPTMWFQEVVTAANLPNAPHPQLVVLETTEPLTWNYDPIETAKLLAKLTVIATDNLKESSVTPNPHSQQIMEELL